MEIKDLSENREYIAFSDDTIHTSYERVTHFVHENPSDFDIYNLTQQIDKDLLSILGTIVDRTASERLTKDSTNIEIDMFNEEFNDSISTMDEKLKRILDVTMIRNIFVYMDYAPKNVNDQLLRELYLHKHSEDLSFIWFYSFRNRLIKEGK